MYPSPYTAREMIGEGAERRLHVASGNRPPPVIDFPSTRWSLEPVEIRLAFRTVAALPRRQIVVIKFHHGEGVREREGIIEREREEGGGVNFAFKTPATYHRLHVTGRIHPRQPTLKRTNCPPIRAMNCQTGRASFHWGDNYYTFSPFHHFSY